MAPGPNRPGLHLPMPVWDAPTRLFHWALVICLVTSVVSVKLLGNMALHMTSGACVLTLLLFRIVWGFVGSDTARFAHFLRGPGAALRYLVALPRRGPDTQVGHSAAGGWMVMILLALLLVQTITGLFANDVDSFVAGPLAGHLSDAAGTAVWHWHIINIRLILLAVLIHVAAITAFGLIKRHDLVRPMLTGRKRLPAATPAPRMVNWRAAAAIGVLCALLVWVVMTRL